MTTFHAFDEQGYYLGSSPAPRNPITGRVADVSPGVATTAALPVFDTETHRARWQGGAWAVEAIPEPEFEPTPEPEVEHVPHSCTRRQGRLALLSLGMLDDAEVGISAIEDATKRRAAQIEYEADTWERSNPFMQQMWTSLGGTPETLDDAFRLAVTL